jgi:oxygen-independent coproporphyrinogen-3 oxidase
MAKGQWNEASDEVCAQQYEILCETLRQAGYHHYEISNFAQPGHEARHNSAYWNHTPYIGLGPGAHSYIPNSRKWNNPDLMAYIDAGKSGDFSAVSGGEDLTEEQLGLERLMLGLRTSKGLSADFLEGYCSVEAIRSALDEGLLQFLDNGFVRIPEDNFFISDAIIANLSL